MNEIVARAWQLLERPRAYAGFANGLRYPSIIQKIAAPRMDRQSRAVALMRLLGPIEATGTALPIAFFEPDETHDPRSSTVDWFLAIADHLNALAGLPIVDRSLKVLITPQFTICAVPCLGKGLTAMSALLGNIRDIASNPEISLHEDVVCNFARLRAANDPTSNGPRLIRAAVESGIVVQEIGGGRCQYGLGKYSTIMESTFTEHTSAIAAQIARDKVVASQILARHRLPVARHRIAETLDQALSAATEIGYPVVVKPRDLDGGAGVSADLQTPGEVRTAFEAASATNRPIMVEKHVYGRDYRLYVFRGEMVWAVERVPAGVVGDGRRSIAELVALLNEEPGRGEGVHARLHRVTIDGEALDLLARDHLTLDSIPVAGRFCRLRRIANVSTGGRPVAVFDKVHPDNAKLVVRATAAVGLDLAGVDLIIPDIGVSWHEGGAIICEINAKPQIGGNTTLHIYPRILRSLLGGDGNIPVIGIAGSKGDGIARDVAAELHARGLRAGVHMASGIAIDDEWLERGRISSLAAGRALSGDKRIEALVLGAIDGDVLLSGLPVPRIDLLLVAGDKPFDAELMRFLKPCCKTVVRLGRADTAQPARASVLRDALNALLSSGGAEM